MRIIKWGNSLAVRLPASVVKALDLTEGDEVEIHVAGTRKFAMARQLAHTDLLKRLRAFRGVFLPISNSTGRRRTLVVSDALPNPR